jgi:carbamoyltransferase
MYSPEEFHFCDIPLTERYPAIFTPGKHPTAILGIGALTHDTSAALVASTDGEVLYASAEERLSNEKHDSHFPIGTINRCCEIAQARGYQIELVAVNFSPDLFLPSVIADELSSKQVPLTTIQRFTDGLGKLARQMLPLDLQIDSQCRRMIAELINEVVNGDLEFARTLTLRVSWYYNVAVKYQTLANHIKELFLGTPVRFLPHHDCHAASTFFGCAEPEAAVLVVDGHGEVDTTTIYRGDRTGLTRIANTRWPASLGSVYLAITRYLGFEYGDEYKVMGMAAYGRPIYLQPFLDAVLVTKACAIQYADTEYFGTAGVRGGGQVRFFVRDSFKTICQPRLPDEPILQEHFNLAASVQALIEKLGVELALNTRQLTGMSTLAIAGGVGLNGLMNEAIRRSGSFNDIFIYPAASDDGTSAGAAMHVLIERGVRSARRMNSSYSGYAPKVGEIEAALAKLNVRYSRPESINRQIAEAIAEGKIVARYVGQAEYGPRALGHRSILANPALSGMKDTLNLRVKHREQFRPFAPACLREYVNKYFEFDGDAPFMIMIVRALDSAKLAIPSVVHNDGTARVQTVTIDNSPDFHRTLEEFMGITGIPVLINTSFNVNGEAIVDTPQDAIESFSFMDIDCLAIGDYWVEKVENTNILDEISHDEYLSIRKKRYRETQMEAISQVDVRKYAHWFFPSLSVVSTFVSSILFGAVHEGTNKQ